MSNNILNFPCSLKAKAEMEERGMIPPTPPTLEEIDLYRRNKLGADAETLEKRRRSSSSTLPEKSPAREKKPKKVWGKKDLFESAMDIYTDWAARRALQGYTRRSNFSRNPNQHYEGRTKTVLGHKSFCSRLNSRSYEYWIVELMITEAAIISPTFKIFMGVLRKMIYWTSAKCTTGNRGRRNRIVLRFEVQACLVEAIEPMVGAYANPGNRELYEDWGKLWGVRQSGDLGAGEYGDRVRTSPQPRTEESRLRLVLFTALHTMLCEESGGTGPTLDSKGEILNLKAKMELGGRIKALLKEHGFYDHKTRTFIFPSIYPMVRKENFKGGPGEPVSMGSVFRAFFRYPKGAKLSDRELALEMLSTLNRIPSVRPPLGPTSLLFWYDLNRRQVSAVTTFMHDFVTGQHGGKIPVGQDALPIEVVAKFRCSTLRLMEAFLDGLAGEGDSFIPQISGLVVKFPGSESNSWEDWRRGWDLAQKYFRDIAKDEAFDFRRINLENEAYGEVRFYGRSEPVRGERSCPLEPFLYASDRLARWHEAGGKGEGDRRPF